jgi:hypothetical protein
MKTQLLPLFMLFLPVVLLAQLRDVETKQLGKFGPMEISFRTENDFGKVSKSIVGSYQSADADDVTDIGAVFFSDSATVISFCNHLAEAVEALNRKKGISSWVTRTYQVNAIRDIQRVRVSSVGRNSSAYANLTAIQAQKLSESLSRSASLLGQ